MSTNQRQERKRVFEQFEKRLVMSANALTHVSPELLETADEVARQVQIATVLEQAHEQTGVAQVHEQYGFDGEGQTIAVIDSGIAWDHYAFGGGGFGEGSRVVGGYDFAENDHNPYDDGPAGYHGTHISGIIGSSDSSNLGVASGVDLVSLRVFDDAGNGNLEWVEQALQWVHEHKDDFEHPITTVNLSIGTEWNADTVPDWATLEDEFSLLEDAGIFISVAAGNNFQNYGESGLSYPAVSSHVVPVASHGNDGQLSDFSQRDSRVLVAPGESIRSAVPGHMFGGNDNDRYLGSSGTSMAAPYVAGASALLRQANEFMGNGEIDQDALYQQFLQTADRIWDSVTQGHFYRINVEAAIDAVVQDLHANHYGQATEIGEIQTGTVVEGTIGKLSDIDSFEFLANESGKVTLTLETTHDLAAFVGVEGQNVSLVDNHVTFDVEAGETYRFKVGSDAGIGHYHIDFTIESGPNIQAVEFGRNAFKTFPTQHVNGQQWYQLTAANEGIFTLITNSQAIGQNYQIQVFDADMNEVRSGATNSGHLRMDWNASEGEEFFVKMIADDANIEMNVTNLVSIRSGTLAIQGTHGNDQISVEQSGLLLIDVNGTSYTFNANNFDSISVQGNGGHDSFSAEFGANSTDVILRKGSLFGVNQRLSVWADGFENIHAESGSSHDRVILFDSLGSETVTAQIEQVSMTGNGFQNSAAGFKTVIAHSTFGYDTIRMEGSAGSDRFFSVDGRSALTSGGTRLIANNFERVEVNGNGGSDTATVIAGVGGNEVQMNQRFLGLTNSNYSLAATGFRNLNVRAHSDADTLTISDSNGDDQFVGHSDRTFIRSQHYAAFTEGFHQVTVNATGGNDSAVVFDSNMNDTIVMRGVFSRIYSNTRNMVLEGFDVTAVRAENGGIDRAFLYGTEGNDSIFAEAGMSSLTNSNGVISRVVGAEVVDLDGRGGNDVAVTRGSHGNDVLRAGQDLIEFRTVLQELRLRNVEHTRFDGNGGLDEVIFDDFEELDLLTALGDQATAFLNRQKIEAEDFDFLQASTAHGHASNYDIESVDYFFMLRGAWQEQ